jgi:hypothetical protein
LPLYTKSKRMSVMEAKKQNIENARKASASTMNGFIETLDKIPRVMVINPKTINTLTTFFIIYP